VSVFLQFVNECDERAVCGGSDKRIKGREELEEGEGQGETLASLGSPTGVWPAGWLRQFGEMLSLPTCT